ncbi:MAG: MBL fold metallo-hydrolase [Chloroflexia bacterium]|nr:MBL fold metallo-hydrolase [Chloroflexia bacterium]
MYVPLSDRVGYVPGGTNIGIIRNDESHVTLIDSGLNDTTARKVLRCVRDELDSDVVAILNTHGHADHFGANAFVVKRTECQVWAPEIESATIQHPILQPAMLFGGADPMDALRNRFLLAEPSPVDGVLSAGAQHFMGTEIELVALPGHSPNQVGVLADGVFFCADVVFPKAAIDKYRISYLYGLTAHLESIEVARSVVASAVVPGHGAHNETIEPLVALNRSSINATLDCLRSILKSPKTSDDICTQVFTEMNVPVSDVQGYFLLKPTINAYLAHLDRIGEAACEIENKQALWHIR